MDSLQRVFFALRNPHVILVFRDMLATIQAEQRFDKTYEVDPPRSFYALSIDIIRLWEKNLEIANGAEAPIMLVSYERAMLHPNIFVTELAGFLSVALDDTQRAAVLERINRSGGYLEVPEAHTHRRKLLKKGLAGD